jgi:hypothetical protein
MRQLRIRRGRAYVAAAVVGVLAVTGFGSEPTWSAFYARTTNAGNNITAAGSFPNYPTSVGNSTPWAYHRGEEAASSAATSTAQDASGNARPGTYGGGTDGSTTHWEFDENTGSTAYDSSGAVNTGTLVNGPTWVPGSSGSALTFNGTSQYVDGTRAAVVTDRSFTVSAWVYMTAKGVYRTAVSQDGQSISGFFLLYDPGPDKWALTMHAADNTTAPTVGAYSNAPAALNTWYHLVGVYDSNAQNITLYVNGVPQQTVSFTGAWKATGPLAVGRGKFNGAVRDQWPGMIDDVRVFDRAVPAATAASLASGGDQLRARYNFSEGTGTTTADSSPYATSPTLSSTSWTSTGHSGNGLAFNGSSSSVNGPSGLLSTTSSFSVSAWVKISDKSIYRTVVSQDGNNISGFFLQYNKGADRWGFVMYGADSTGATRYEVVGTQTPELNAWYHLIGVYDSTAHTIKLYVNGLFRQAAFANPWPALGAFQVGRARWNGVNTDFWAGTIDGVHAYQRALTDTDIATLSTDPAPGTQLRAKYEFSEYGGTAVADSSGRNNNATATGTTWTEAGHAWYALNYDGFSDSVTGPNAVVTTNTSFSVAAWVYLRNKATYRTAVSQDGNSVSGFYLQYDDTPDRWAFSFRNSDSTTANVTQATSAATPTLNTWYHLVGVYDGVGHTIKLYVNGSLASTVPYTNGWSATGAFQVGRGKFNGNPADFWDGTIDSVRAYQRAVSATDVATMYNGVSPVAPPMYTDPAMTAGIVGALQGPQQGLQASTSIAFAGVGSAVSTVSMTNPTAFTIECWFRADDHSSGVLVGFGDTPTGSPGTYDREIYLENGGRLTFVTNPGTPLSVRSPTAYDDGDWHHVVGSLGAAGLKLYVDGNLVASDGTITTAGNYTGYWRWGGSTRPPSTWPYRPLNGYFTGTIDEVAIYASQLSDQQVAWHYHANH